MLPPGVVAFLARIHLVPVSLGGYVVSLNTPIVPALSPSVEMGLPQKVCTSSPHFATRAEGFTLGILLGSVDFGPRDARFSLVLGSAVSGFLARGNSVLWTLNDFGALGDSYTTVGSKLVVDRVSDY